jgi:hypothetical protein
LVEEQKAAAVRPVLDELIGVGFEEQFVLSGAVGGMAIQIKMVTTFGRKRDPGAVGRPSRSYRYRSG